MPKRKAKIIGVQLPETGKGKRSSTPFNKSTWIAAADAISSDAAAKFSKNLDAEKKFRFGYIKYVQEHMRLCADPEDCLKAAQAGWDYVYKNMEYYRVEGGKAQSLAECLETPNPDAAFETGILEGKGEKKTKLTIPIGKKTLSQGGAVDLVKRWQGRGVIEADTGNILASMLQDNSWLKSLENKVFVLLGALSEMGPLQPLLDYGATVVAVDYSAGPVQERLFKQLEGRAGKLIVPLKPGTLQLNQSEWAANAGADLLFDFPEVAEWLVGVCPEKEMIIGPYCYLDGERFIKIVSAMDGICQTVAKKRSTPTGIVCYATPTDCHMVTPEVVNAAKKQSHGGLAGFFSMFSAKPSFPSADNVNGVPFVNCVVPEQGPNYILAKRMQTWRAMLARKNGQIVSLNVAPTTKTVSVMKNKIFAFTMAGMSSFEPMEPFETLTTKAVMSALLINDFCNKNSKSNPATELDHPLNILQTTSVHGGMYRVGKSFASVGMPAFFVAVTQKYWWAFVLFFVGLFYLAKTLGLF